jgi:hypothetical protein
VGWLLAAAALAVVVASVAAVPCMRAVAYVEAAALLVDTAYAVAVVGYRHVVPVHVVAAAWRKHVVVNAVAVVGYRHVVPVHAVVVAWHKHVAVSAVAAAWHKYVALNGVAVAWHKYVVVSGVAVALHKYVVASAVVSGAVA